VDRNTNFKILTNEFYCFEKEFNLFEKKVADIYIWELVRWGIHRQILQRAGVYGQTNTTLGSSLDNPRRRILRGIKNLFVKNAFLSKQCDILFFGVSRRKKMEDGLWWDIYCDPVIDHLKHDYSCLLLERPYQGVHLVPSKTSNIRYFDLVEILASVVRKTKNVRISISKKEQRMLLEIQQQIEERFDVSIDDLSIIALNKLLVRKSELIFYSRLLKKCLPRVVVLICSYGEKVLIEACKNLGIPVVELQHGTSMGRYHPGYSFPKEYKAKLTFPDYLMTFGDFWTNRAEYPIGVDKIFSVGFPYFEKEAKKYHHIEKKEQIVFISQGIIGNGKKMSQFAIDLHGKKNFPYDVIYKLHPGEYAGWADEYPWLIGSGVKVVDSDAVPLYRILAESKAQVGVYSTVIYEGLGFGLPTFLLNLPGVEYMEELVESKAVTVISKVDELVEMICQDAQHKISDEFFFRSNALENVSIMFDAIIRKSD